MAIVYGTNNSDVLNTYLSGVTKGSDTIFGYGGEDWISGDGGDDILQGGAGPDHLYGDGGHDTANYADSGEGVYVNLATGEAHYGTAEGDTFNSIENLFGSVANDFLIGNAYDNVLSGSWGDDRLMGGGGGDVLDGGGGSDTAIYYDSPNGVWVSLLWDLAFGGSADGDQLNSIENLWGSNHDDSLFGDNGANVLLGAGGDDLILGFGGPDTLVGDGLRSTPGNDSLDGGGGNDVLVGGKGIDSLTGGADADLFVWYYADESPGMNASGQNNLANADVILDFNFAEGDHIDVTNVDANSEVFGVQATGFEFIGEHNTVGGFTAPGQVAYFHAGGDTYLIFNTDSTFHTASDADYEFAIKISGEHTPSQDWFSLVYPV